MSIFVVRHATAGSRHRWDGDDVERPLSDAGRRQAAAITERLKGERVTGLYSSPFVRCVQTLDLVAAAGDGAVHCSHGDVIPDVIGALVRRGTKLRTPPDWRKATIWILDAPDGDGHISGAAVEPPPT